MAFLDKMSNIAKNVGDKAGDAIEITKLNAKISGEKKAIEEVLVKIGNLYYDKYTQGQATDPEAAQFMAEIDSHRLAIQQAEEQIRITKAD